jgi:uncharacterized OB-fold protein
MSDEDLLARPVPVSDAASASYWEGARLGKLMIARCAECSFYIHPPRSTCPRCEHEEVVAHEVSGRGRIYTFSVMHLPGVPGFTPPYAVAVIELAEQAGLFAVGNVLDCEPEELAIDAPVRVAFEQVSDTVTLPQWRLDRE